MSIPLKRNWEESFDSDDEEPTLGTHQILPIANLPDDFDSEPCDGLQYLFTVRRDARNLPHVTRVKNPYEVDEPAQAPVVKKARGENHSFPTDEWLTSFTKRMKNFRLNVAQPTTNVEYLPSGNHKIMPDLKARDCWWAFLFGKPEADWNPPNKSKLPKPDRYSRHKDGMRGFSDEVESEPEQEAEETPRQETWLVNEDGEVELDVSSALDTHVVAEETLTLKRREPTPSLIRHMSHRLALQLLMYFTYWINLHIDAPKDPAKLITETHARWIFAIFSRVEDFLSADDQNLLRNLARASINLLKGMKRVEDVVSDEQSVGKPIGETSCWMILATVVGVWGQKDLWMDAESMLDSSGG